MIHATTADLEEALESLREAPRDAGTVELVVRRPAVEQREVLDEGALDPDEGLVGDRFSGNPDMHLTLMSVRYAQLIAGPRDRWPLAGDQLYVDLDLSEQNLPPGTRLKVGSAVIEITAEPHTGCGKFIKRFGADALKFANSAVGRELNLRGIYAKVVEGGTVRPGDEIRVSSRQ